jgi:hypothetical protein
MAIWQHDSAYLEAYIKPNKIYIYHMPRPFTECVQHQLLVHSVVTGAMDFLFPFHPLHPVLPEGLKLLCCYLSLCHQNGAHVLKILFRLLDLNPVTARKDNGSEFPLWCCKLHCD